MNAWGSKVQELLDANHKKPSWLAHEIRAARSTVSNWLNNPEGVTPSPLMVAKVAKVFGLKTRDLAPYAGYPISASLDDTVRTARRTELRESPRAAAMLDGLEQLNARDQDTVMSMVEAFITSRRSKSE